MGRRGVSVARLVETADALMQSDKGLLAMDESTATCNRRFAAAGIAQSPAQRRAYRDLLATAPGLGASISGAILYDETIRQCVADGTPIADTLAQAGIIPGIKVDTGTSRLALHGTETVTEGLDGLRPRLLEYSEMGARFAKWRGVFEVGDRLPSAGSVVANAHALARYAALCQETGLVPIVEPEVLMTGAHTLSQCGAATEAVLHFVFAQLRDQGVMLEGMILKPNMVLPGFDCSVQESVGQVADATIACLLRGVPAAVAGVTFLSGGQSGELASARLNAMNLRARASRSRVPWPLSFSFGRALQEPALSIWHGEATNRGAAQLALLHRARCNAAARRGEYAATMEAA
jgi:fructose-bisphosphate aldolase class I